MERFFSCEGAFVKPRAGFAAQFAPGLLPKEKFLYDAGVAGFHFPRERG